MLLRLAKANNITYPLPEEMTYKELSDLLYPSAEGKPEYKILNLRKYCYQQFRYSSSNVITLYRQEGKTEISL